MKPQAQKPKTPTTVQVGRHTRTLPASTATPEGLNRAALVRQLDRVDALKAAHAKELEAKNEQLAQQARDHRHDSLVVIASQRAEQAGLDAVAVKKFINNVLNADARPRPAGVKFDVYACMKELLDQAHKDSGGAAGVVDVRKLSATEYAEHCRKRGLHNPALGSHMPV